MQKCYPLFYSKVHLGMLYGSNNCTKKNPVHKICLLTYELTLLPENPINSNSFITRAGSNEIICNKRHTCNNDDSTVKPTIIPLTEMSMIWLPCILLTLLSWNFLFFLFFCFFVTCQQKLSLFFVIIPSLSARHFSTLIRHSLCSFCLFTLHSLTCCIINATVTRCKKLLSHTYDIHNLHATL